MKTFEIVYSFGGTAIIEAESIEDANAKAEAMTMEELLRIGDMSHYAADDIEIDEVTK